MTKKILFWISLCVSFSCGLNAGFANNFDEISEQFRAKADNDQDLAKYIVNLETQIKRKRQGSALQGLLRLFYNAAPYGKLEIDKIPLLEAKDHAQLRSREIGRVLKWDLDGDGAISKTERESFAGSDAADIEFLFAIGDTDKNGTVNIVEITAFAAKNLRKSQRASKYTPLTLFDIDGDGIVLLQEIIKGLEALEKFPLDLRIKHVPQIKRSNEAKNRCKAPAPDAKSQLMILSGYEGRALSSVSIAGMDGVTHVAKVTIEPGKSPIYLFLSAYSNMIWQISGTTDRLQKVVVQKGRGGAGVVGVEKSKIHFIDAESCLGGVWDLKGGKGIIAINQAEKNLGRKPDHMSAYYSIGSISLPSGVGAPTGKDGDGTDIVIYNGKRYELSPKGPKLLDDNEGHGFGTGEYGVGQTTRSLFRFHPDGVRDLDPLTVVASGKAVKYDVMPQEAGLLQLLFEKKIKYTRDKFFVIEKQIKRFPAGLSGSHSVKFILGKGVVMPEGSPGHSSVYSATGECLMNRCR